VLINEHGDGIVWISERRTPFLNTFFVAITKVGEEWTYVLLLVILLCYRFKYAILVFALAILVPLVSISLKSFFSRPRPMKYFMDNGLFENLNVIEGVRLYTANTSFPSGHTISAFAVLGFAAYVARRYNWAGLLLGILAILVAISRVYMVQHFLVDVCAGAVLGSLIAWFVSWLSLRLRSDKYLWLDKNIFNLRKSSPKV